jgi:predicted alpha/beta-hydrolase family hydrolase
LTEITIPLETSATTALVYPAEGRVAGATFVLAHGAGAGQNSTFIVEFANALSSLGLDVVTFNFLYAEQRRRIPDRAPALESCFRHVIARVRDEVPSARAALFVGGKSMGGRIATQVAAADATLPLDGLVLLGYPLHPPGKPDQRRDKHLPDVGRPMLFVQGTRDAFGTPAERAPIVDALGASAALHIVDGGDHSFKTSKKDPAAQSAVYGRVQQAVTTWMNAITAGKRGSRTRAPSPRPGA